HTEPRDPKFVLVDQPRKHFPRHQRRVRVEISHVVDPYLSNDTKFTMAQELLDYYREEAGLVVTSRIHCAMPCAAMGIPVVYTGVREGRTEVIDLLGIPSIRTRFFPKTDIKNLNIQPVDF